MTKIAVMLMCAAAEGFLLYVLIHFARELRKDRIARGSTGVIPIAQPASEETAEHRKVIEITVGSGVPSYGSGRRVAF